MKLFERSLFKGQCSNTTTSKDIKGLNVSVHLSGDDIFLVPYLKEHVSIYHDWMKDPFLQDMTASMPLSLQEEYEMQESWREDEDSCVFLILPF